MFGLCGCVLITKQKVRLTGEGDEWIIVCEHDKVIGVVGGEIVRPDFDYFASLAALLGLNQNKKVCSSFSRRFRCLAVVNDWPGGRRWRTRVIRNQRNELLDGCSDLSLQCCWNFVADLGTVDFMPGRRRESVRSQYCWADTSRLRLLEGLWRSWGLQGCLRCSWSTLD